MFLFLMNLNILSQEIETNIFKTNPVLIYSPRHEYCTTRQEMLADKCILYLFYIH